MGSAADRLRSIRIATRTLRKQPVFTAAVILSLGLAIALNTTLYAVFDALVRPRLAMAHPERLFAVRYYGDYGYAVDNVQRDAALATGMRTYEAITRVEPSVFSGGGDALIERRDAPNFYEGYVAGVGTSYFDVLGVRPLAGRTFTSADEQAETSPIVISSG